MPPTPAYRRFSMFAAAALLVTAIGLKPVVVHAMGTDSPPPSDDGQGKKKKKGGSATEDLQQQQQAYEQFLRGYREARDEILSGDYKGGIAAMHALGHDENADVANYIGYANRKLGNYDQSKEWYDKALAADPDHVRTWSYYGMWHAEQGNKLMAQEYLEKVRLICGNESCEEYVKLKGVIEGTMTY